MAKLLAFLILFGFGSLTTALFDAPDGFRSGRLPNIIFILADDLGYGDVSSYNPAPRGNISTPHIDKLGQRGMTFTDAHSTSSVCTPSRYSILTGRYNWRTRLKNGVLNGYDAPLISANRATLASVLKEVGYTTACIGKWHLGLSLHDPHDKGAQHRQLDAKPQRFGAPQHALQRSAQVAAQNRAPVHVPLPPQKRVAGQHVAPKVNRQARGGGPKHELSLELQQLMLGQPIMEGPRQLGFDVYHGISASLDMPPYLYINNNTFIDGAEAIMKPKNVPGRNGVTSKAFTLVGVLDTIAKKANEFLLTHVNEKSPVFLYLPLTSPHTPVVPSPAFRGRSQLGPYGDFVMQTDDVVGQIVSTLTQLKALDNTLIIFTSDNGYTNAALSDPANAFRHPHAPCGIYRGMKADIYEGGHRIPFVAQWPRVIPPRTINKTPISHVDVFATFLDITNQGTVPRTNRGEDSATSLLPLFLGQCDSLGPNNECVATSKGSGRNYLSSSGNSANQFIVHSFLGCFAIRQGKYLLALCGGSGGWSQPVHVHNKMFQFYDLEADPSQKNDLSKSFNIKDPSTGKPRIFMDTSCETAYIHLVLGMIRIFHEWENEASSKPVMISHGALRSMVADQIKNNPLRGVKDVKYLEGLDEGSVRFIQDCVLSSKCGPDGVATYRKYFIRDQSTTLSAQ